MIKCPRCARVFAVAVSAPTTQAAKETKLAVAAKETKLAASAKETKLGSPAKVTKVAAAAQETKLAGTAKETKLAAAAKKTEIAARAGKETKLVTPASKEARPTKPATALESTPPPPASPKPVAEKTAVPAKPFQITCPSCRATATWKVGQPLPLGKRIKCPRCAAVYRVPVPALRRPDPAIAKPTPKPATAATPAAPKAPTAPAPVIRYVCPGCKVSIKSAARLAAGTLIQCPRCRQKFGVTGKEVAEAPKLSVPLKDTKKALPPSAKTTTLAPPSAKQTKLASAPDKGAAGRRPVGRMPCPACKTILKFVGVPPAGKPIKCPKCAKSFLVRVKSRSKVAPTAKTGVQPRKTAPGPPPAAVRGPVGPKPSPQAPAASRPRPAPPPPPPRRVVAGNPHPRRNLVVIGLFALALICFGLYTWVAGWWGRGIPASAWVEFRPPEGRCQILMPGTPKAEPALWNGPGIVRAQKFKVVRKDEEAAFLLTYSDWSAAVTGKKSFQDLYTPERDYLLELEEAKEAKVVAENDITLNGHAGKELQIELKEGGRLLARVYLVRGQPYDRLYILVAIGSRLQPGQGDAAKFFDSFKIDGPVSPVHRPREKSARLRTA
jgi:hypothetical protein